MTTCIEDKGDRVLLCLDRKDGKVVWERVAVTVKKEGKHGLNSYASATPVTDGRRIWVAFQEETTFVIKTANDTRITVEKSKVGRKIEAKQGE